MAFKTCEVVICNLGLQEVFQMAIKEQKIVLDLCLVEIFFNFSISKFTIEQKLSIVFNLKFKPWMDSGTCQP